MSFATLAEMFCLGAAFGGFGGFFGVGGGIVAIPMLVLLFHMTQQVAEGTALVMMFPTVLRGFWKYQKRNCIDLRMAAILSASGLVSTYIAALVANSISSFALRIAFSVFLGLVAIGLACSAHARVCDGPRREPLRRSFSWLVGATGGALSGLFGVGGAILASPALNRFFGLTQTTAQGLALAMIAPGTLVSLIVYSRAGAVEWDIGIAMAFGGLIAVPLGVAAAHNIREQTLRLLFSGFVMLSALTVFVIR
jgi:uncharacterized protein